jgi:hypothetical protein
VREAQAIIRRHSKNEASVRFRDVRMGADGVVCGEMNGNNSFGALAGYSPFVVFTDRSFLTGTDAVNVWGKLCR